VEEERDKEHPFVLVQVCNIEDRMAWSSLLCREEPRNIECLPIHPGLERGCGDDMVQPHGKGEPLLCREEGLDIECPDLFQRGILDRLDQCHQVQVFSIPPELFEERGEEDVLP